MPHLFCNADQYRKAVLLGALRCGTHDIAWPGRVGQGLARAWYGAAWSDAATAWHGWAGQGRYHGGRWHQAIALSIFIEDSRPTNNRRVAGGWRAPLFLLALIPHGAGRAILPRRFSK
jgi:hypothetical protein